MNALLKQDQNRPHERPYKILLADDEEDMRTTIETILKSLNCEVYQAVNGIEALDIFNQTEDLDLIILDALLM